MPLINNPRKFAYYSILLSVSIILQAIEYFFLPSIPIPGVKIGLAYVIILMMLGVFSNVEICMVVIGRVVIASLIMGRFLTPAFYFSMVGGLVSFLAIILFYRLFSNKISLIGFGVIGAVTHNIGQIFVAYLIFSKVEIFAYTPLLTIIAIPFGIITGIIAQISVNRIKKSGFEYSS